MMSAPRGTSVRLALSAAGFIATSTSGASPGVRMSWSAKCTWKLETPGSVPAGARISAGKLGSVERSLPKVAVSWVNRSPASCMPSPESPANLIMTRSSLWTCLVTAFEASSTRRGRVTDAVPACVLSALPRGWGAEVQTYPPFYLRAAPSRIKLAGKGQAKPSVQVAGPSLAGCYAACQPDLRVARHTRVVLLLPNVSDRVHLGARDASNRPPRRMRRRQLHD